MTELPDKIAKFCHAQTDLESLRLCPGSQQLGAGSSQLLLRLLQLEYWLPAGLRASVVEAAAAAARLPCMLTRRRNSANQRMSTQDSSIQWLKNLISSHCDSQSQTQRTLWQAGCIVRQTLPDGAQ